MNILMIRSSDSTFVRVADYPTYALAVRAGQDLAPGNFYIDTGTRVPSREEQLLIEPKLRVSRRQAILDTL
jgi:hypothetical protein